MPLTPNAQNTNEANNMPTAMPATDEARYAALAIQVQGLDADYKELKNIVVGLDRKIDTSNAALSNKIELMVSGLGAKFEASVTSIQAKLDERSKIQWPAFSVLLGALALAGALVYWPIRENTGQLRDDMTYLSRRLQDSRETIARHDEVQRNIDARLNAISGRLAEHIRDVTRIDRRVP